MYALLFPSNGRLIFEHASYLFVAFVVAPNVFAPILFKLGKGLFRGLRCNLVVKMRPIGCLNPKLAAGSHESFLL